MAAEATKPGRCLRASSGSDKEHNVQPKIQPPQQLPVKTTGEAVIILPSIQRISKLTHKLGALVTFDPHFQSHVLDSM